MSFFVLCRSVVVVVVFQNYNVSKNTFRHTIRVLGSLDPDKARHFVMPYLGPNGLKTLSSEETRMQQNLVF